MSKSYYNINKVTDDKVFITDDGVDVVSVIDDAECVVKEIITIYPGKRIICRDNKNQWNEMVYHNDKFVKFVRYTESL